MPAGFYSAVKKNQMISFCRKMDGTGDHHFRQNKTGSQRKVFPIFCHTIQKQKGGSLDRRRPVRDVMGGNMSKAQ